MEKATPTIASKLIHLVMAVLITALILGLGYSVQVLPALGAMPERPTTLRR